MEKAIELNGPFKQIENSYVVLKTAEAWIVRPVFKRGTVFHTEFGGFIALYKDGKTSRGWVEWDEIELAGATGIYC